MHAPHAVAGALALVLSLSGTSSANEEFDQHGAHEHGHLTLNVVVQDSLLSIELESPAANVLGYEHAPRTADEKAQWDRQLQWLRSGRDAVGVPVAAGCQLSKVDIEAPDPAAKGAQEHSDFRVRWQFQCRNAAALAWFEPWLIQKLLGVEEVDVNLVNGAVQKRLEASEPRQRIPLR
jgi:Protein of unknown function (DUF2796)